MNKFVFMGLLLSGSVTAQGVVKWEYGFLETGPAAFEWRTAGKSVVAKTQTFKELIPLLGCKGANWLDFYNCLGRQGWEFVGTNNFTPSFNDLTYIFKRRIN